MPHRIRTIGWAMALALLAAGLATGSPAPAAAAAPGTTEVVSLATGGGQGTGSAEGGRVSADGRFVVLSSFAALAAGDTNATRDHFLRDRQSGTTVQADLTDGDAPPNSGGGDPGDVSDDGRYVVFSSPATDQVPGPDGNAGAPDVFLRDRVAGTTVRISDKADGTQPAQGAYEPRISGDGRYVAFTAASSLLPADADAYYDVYRWDRLTDALELVTVDEDDAEIVGWTYKPDISADGDVVIFTSDANDVAGSDLPGRDVFARDLSAGTTTLVSSTSAGAAVAGGGPGSDDPSISADGRWVVFESYAALVAGDTNERTDVYRKDLQTGATVRVSLTDADAQVTTHDSIDPDVSADGNLVAFASAAVLRTGDTNGVDDIWVRDLAAGTTKRASLTTGGAQATQPSRDPDLADDGSVVAFTTSAKLAAADTDAIDDVYVHTLGLVTTCEPPGPFSDVAYTHPFCDDIDWLVAEGITTGYVDGTFKPSAGLSRMAMAAFIYRFAGSPTFPDPAVATFSDVPTSHPFFTEIEWMKAQGLTNGYADGTFRPASPISRMAMAAFLYRLAGSPAFTDPAVATFTDVTTAHPFFTEIEWMAATALVDGFSDGSFRPATAVTRDRMAAFLHGFATAGLVV